MIQESNSPTLPTTSERTLGWLTLVGVVALWCGAFWSPWIFDAAVLVTSLWLVHRWRHQGRRRLALAMGIVPAALLLIAMPGIAFDSGLATVAVKAEVLWSTLIVGLIVALAGCGIAVGLTRSRSGVISILALAICVGSIAIYFHAMYYSHVSRIEQHWRFSDRGLSIRTARIEGSAWFHWGYSEPRPRLNHFRTNNAIPGGSGSRVYLAGLVVSYLHSSRDGVDFFASPKLLVQLPFLLVALGSGLLVVPWPYIARWYHQHGRPLVLTRWRGRKSS